MRTTFSVFQKRLKRITSRGMGFVDPAQVGKGGDVATPKARKI
jgi:hypothetical protein